MACGMSQNRALLVASTLVHSRPPSFIKSRVWSRRRDRRAREGTSATRVKGHPRVETLRLQVQHKLPLKSLSNTIKYFSQILFVSSA